MQPLRIADRYIGKTIFTTIMMTLFMLVSLRDHLFVDQLKKPGRGATMRWGPGCIRLKRAERYPDLPDGGAAGVLLYGHAGPAQ